ncbi:Alpha-2,8-sialyltransferase 8B [Holothuria leucospilota]|uniref:Alpha-2,8-sialyltransferase 8B n=1 Tax=Holothuria leucospilota TaxID=206669 RepID=A0A9Q0YE12_HOLLE|nr:Alpha-2,8-sialyltransferase 8B [Holothuria leucospilota]
MNRNVFAFMICCFLCLLNLLAFNYKSVENTWVFVSDVKATVVTSVRKFETARGLKKVDVFKLCEKICDRKMNTCFSPTVAILVYKDTKPENMTFRQTFSSFFVSNGTLSKQSLEKWSRKRKFCSIADLDPSFDTVKSRNSCAIIGNSGILLNSRCGREIDAHDVVLRANMAKVKGYADDVGNKTSVMMINGESLRHIYDILIATKDNTTNDYNNMLHYFQSLDDSLIWFAKGTGGRNYSIKLQSIATFFWKKGLKAKFGLSILSAYRATSREMENQGIPDLRFNNINHR